jgi:hypothetical protein
MGRHWFETNGEDRNQLYREVTYDAKEIVASRKLATESVGALSQNLSPRTEALGPADKRLCPVDRRGGYPPPQSGLVPRWDASNERQIQLVVENLS